MQLTEYLSLESDHVLASEFQKPTSEDTIPFQVTKTITFHVPLEVAGDSISRTPEDLQKIGAYISFTVLNLLGHIARGDFASSVDVCEGLIGVLLVVELFGRMDIAEANDVTGDNDQCQYNTTSAEN